MLPTPRARQLVSRLVSRLAILTGVLTTLVALAPIASAAPAPAMTPHSEAGGGRQIAYLPPRRDVGLRKTGHAYRPLGSGNLVWRGGDVQHHPTQYLIFWGPTWAASPNTPTPEAKLVQQYFADMAGTPFERVVTQYSDHSGGIANGDTVAAVVLDPSAPPTDQTCGGPTIQDAAIIREIAAMGQAHGWPAPSTDNTYMVYTPTHYAINDGLGDCSTQFFCAYHAWSMTTPGFAYAAIPYPDDPACQAPRSPHHDLAGDSLVSISSHEQIEAITDPNVGTAWMDAANFEIADKCATYYGTGYTTLAHGNRYELQTEYSNASRTCVSSYTPLPPPKHSRSGHRRR